MLIFSTYGKDLTLTRSVLNETVIIQLLLKYSTLVCGATVDKVLWGLAACICARRAHAMALVPDRSWSLCAWWLRAAAVVSGLVSAVVLYNGCSQWHMVWCKHVPKPHRAGCQILAILI